MDGSTGARRASDLEVGDALVAHPWNEIAHSWHRRDNAALRSHLELVLTSGTAATAAPRSPAVADDPLRIWRRLSQAVFAGEHQPLRSLLRQLTDAEVAAEADWSALASLTIDHLAPDLVRPHGPDRQVARATLAVFVYFECLVFWEHGMVYEEIEGIRQAMADRCASLAEARPDDGGDDLGRWALEVERAAVGLAGSVPAQFEVEAAIGCCCPVRLGAASATAHRDMEAVRTELHQLWAQLAAADRTGAGATHVASLRALVALLLADIDQTSPYHRLLATQVAPVSLAYVENLLERDRDTDLDAPLVAAIAACRDFEDSPAGRTSVSASETRAHRLGLEAALQSVRDQTPTLLFDEAEVVFAFPFGLPVAATGDDPVRRTLRAHLRGDAAPAVTELPTIAGVRVTLDDTPQTDAWVEGSELDGLDYVGVRLLFEDDELMLRTSSGELYRDLGVEVRLGGLGNHYVRIEVDTETQRSSDGGATWARRSAPWTPHELDQFVRRGNTSVGAEQVWFRPRSEAAATAPTGTSGPRVEPTFISLAARIVGDIVAFAESLSGPGAPAVTAGPADEPVPAPVPEDAALIASFLERHAQVLVTLVRVSTVAPGQAAAAMEDTEGFDQVLSGCVALVAQRPYAQSVLEWLRYPRPDAEERHLRRLGGRLRRELVWCGGDTTTVFAPSLPNWQLMETRELVEFASSLTGVYSRRHTWLRGSLEDADRRTRDAPGGRGPLGPGPRSDDGTASLAELSTEDLGAELDDARGVELLLDERLNHIQALLDRARNFRMSRDLQSRDVVRHVCSLNGVVDLQEALSSSVAAAGAQQRLVHARVERLQEQFDARLGDDRDERRAKAERPLQLLISALTVFSFIDLFWWSNDSWKANGNHVVWGLQVVALVAIAGVVIAMNLRTNRGQDRHPVSSSTSP